MRTSSRSSGVREIVTPSLTPIFFRASSLSKEMITLSLPVAWETPKNRTVSAESVSQFISKFPSRARSSQAEHSQYRQQRAGWFRYVQASQRLEIRERLLRPVAVVGRQ